MSALAVHDLAVGGDFVWAVGSAPGGREARYRVYQLAADLRSFVAETPLPTRPLAVAYAAGTPWLTLDDGWLYRVDPVQGVAERVVRVGGAPSDLVAVAEGLWITDSRGARVVRVDLVGERIDARVRLGNDPLALASDGTRVWVTVSYRHAGP